ncbi:unnamed protein product, partial [Amoebophrya sp. A25]
RSSSGGSGVPNTSARPLSNQSRVSGLPLIIRAESRESSVVNANSDGLTSISRSTAGASSTAPSARPTSPTPAFSALPEPGVVLGIPSPLPYTYHAPEQQQPYLMAGSHLPTAIDLTSSAGVLPLSDEG